jgi:hypothetical protein
LREPGPDFRHPVGEVFLKASAWAGSWA